MKNMLIGCSEGKLTQWLKLIFRTQTLVDNYYQDWSYVARTGKSCVLRLGLLADLLSGILQSC